MVTLVGVLSGGLAGADEPVPKQGLVSARPPAASNPARFSAPSPIPTPTPVSSSYGPTLPVAEPPPPAPVAVSPAPVLLPRAIIGATSVELFHPESGQFLATIPLREGCFASFQRSDFLYVAHRNSFSVVNLRTQVVHEVKSLLADWQWEQRENLLILHSSDGRAVFYDLIDPAVPTFLRIEVGGANAVRGSKQTRGNGLTTVGYTMLGVGLAHVVTGAVLVSPGTCNAPPNTELRCFGQYLGGFSALGVGGVALVIPGAILLGVGASQRSRP